MATFATLPLADLRQLEDTVVQAVSRRQALKAQRAQAQTQQAALLTKLKAFAPESPSSLTVSEFAGLPQQPVTELLETARRVTAAQDAVAAATRQVAHLEHGLARERETKAKQKRYGWLLLVVVVGVFFLLKARDTTEVDRLEQELQRARLAAAAAERQLDAAREAFTASKARSTDALIEVGHETTRQFARLLEEDAQTWRATWEALPPFLRGDWSEPAWRAHDFGRSYRLPFVATGMMREQPAESRTPFSVPVLSPFLGGHQTLVLSGPAEASLALLQALVVQLATALPYTATFTLLDPSSAGRAFPMQRDLPFVRRVGADVPRELEMVLEDLTRIIHSYLDDQTRSFEHLPEQIQANERFELIFAANFPAGYDRRAIETLQRISRNGPVAGKYLFIQKSPDKELPKDLSWDDFGPRLELDTRHFGDSTGAWVGAGAKRTHIAGYVTEQLLPPEGAAQKTVLDYLAQAKPPETKVSWDNLVDRDPAHWWRETGEKRVLTPVGASGRDRQLQVWFGADRDGRPCAHGILGAMPGAGKSNLYHVLICGLATRYSPDELNLYLIDGKFGVEFAPYRQLPHARVVALHSSPELSRSVLNELVKEMERRNDVFRRHRVVDLPEYAAAGSPEGKIARTVLMVDEYQELFDDDRLGQASAALLQLTGQGRSVGIHLLLGSQRFGAVGMLHQTAIFGNVHLRMAMKMAQSDILALTEFGREGKRLVEQCDMPGKLVINDRSGEDKGNEFGKVALLEAAERDTVLRGLAAKADAEWPAERRFATVVFDGAAQPNFIENPQVVDLIRLPQRPAGEAWCQIAMGPIQQQGFGVSDWFAGEHPMALWLGQEQDVYGQARAVLRRRATENLLLVGDNQSVTYGMLAGLLCSVPVNAVRTAVRLWVVDRAVPGTPWEPLLGEVAEEVLEPLGYDVRRTRDAKQAVAWLDAWCEELARRSALDEESLMGEGTWLLVMAGADRLPQLARVQNKFGALADSPDGEKLRRIYRDGPALGLHVVLALPSAGQVKQLLDRVQFDQFKHRVVTQMAEVDSFLLIGKDAAAKLQRGSAHPVFAIYQDTNSGTEAKFKPYTADAQQPWSQQLNALAVRLAAWEGAT